MYVAKDSASEKESRVVYFESADPDKPEMRVAMTSEAEEKVLSYAWDRSEHAHKHTSPEPLGRANSGTYIHTRGIVM